MEKFCPPARQGRQPGPGLGLGAGLLALQEVVLKELSLGIHERLVTEALGRALQEAPQLIATMAQVDRVEAPFHLSRYLAQILQRVLRESEKVADQVELANRCISLLQRSQPELVEEEERVTPQLLLALVRKDPLSKNLPPERPATPLGQSHLFINARGEPTVGTELIRELASADHVDLLCSFLMWSGYLRLRDALVALLRRGARLRVITTVYCGATERRVLDALHQEGATIKVSYDTRGTRLHAKAWLLHRNSGYSTAFIGSSNLSAAALSDGLEWNVRIGQDNPAVLSKFSAAFEGYWEDPSFEDYDPTRDGTRLERALHGESREDSSSILAFLDVRPFPFQERILEVLEVERKVHGRWKNLVVAATGTGKTVIAALDFRRLLKELSPRPKLLFVAHRKEILLQSRELFRQVLRDGSFGGLLVDGEKPEGEGDLFASIQSLHRVDLSSLSPQSWDVVIVDEFHHAEASTYVKLLEYLQPKVLVGLTATPERADGKDVTRWFGGKIAAELRLWEAIDRGFLVPFQYFGLRDSVDISLYWKRGRVDLEALDRVYSGHHLRARQILAALVDHVASPRRIRAVGFCAGVGHARFMAAQFSSAGLPSQALVGGEPNRDGLMRDFREGRISVLFTVDLLNEGVDVPEIDTILLLRPTESATVFLQQLGRGLRLCEGKRCLTVLDFIATADRSFRFDLRYRALVGGTRAELVRQVEEGFPVLPAGCSIQLAPDAAGVVLENLKAALSPRRDRLVAELRSLGEGCSLRAFLAHTGLELGELYRGRCFTDLKREAGFPMPPAGPEEAKFGTGLGRLLHLDDPELLRELEEEVRQAVPTMLSPVAMVTLLEEAMTQPEEAKRIFRRNPAILEELGELFPLLAEGVGHLPVRLENPAVPLKIHCRYRLEQVMAAFGAVKSGALLRPREGVWFDTQTRSDIFFVTLQKSEKDYSPGTLYEDYAISAERFHWQTQRGTTQNSERGRRNLKHREEGITPLLFVRPRRKDDMGGTVPYSFLGPVELERWEGERPISIVWRLLHPMPADIFATAKVAA